MGNRAYVIFTDPHGTISPAVYLHWNGGPESVYAYLDELARRGLGNGSAEYMAARFTHVAADHFDNRQATAYSLGVMKGPASLKPDDIKPWADECNGLYVVTYQPGRHPNIPRENNGIKWVVSRFVTNDDKLKKLTRREVERERKAAYKHEYHTGCGRYKKETIPGTLRMMRPYTQSNPMPEAEVILANGKVLGTTSGGVPIHEFDGKLFELTKHSANEREFHTVRFLGSVA